MKKIYYIVLGLSLFAVSFSVEIDNTVENTKFKFVQEIYADSWALIIGINKYENVEPLTYAVDDAEAVRLMLMDNYGFKDDNKILYIGLRLYLDQGNYSKRLYYAPDISISDHLVSLVDAFNRQYGKHFSK